MTFSSSSEFTESFDASCQLVQAPVTFLHLMEEQCGDVWRDDQQVWARPGGRDCRQPESKTHADMLLLASATLQPQVWLFLGRGSSINPNIRILGWRRRISLIRWRVSAQWLRQSEGREGIGEMRTVWTVDSIIIIRSSSDSICDCNHIFNALLQKPTPNNAVYHFQWPHKDTRRLFRVIFMSKARLIQL